MKSRKLKFALLLAVAFGVIAWSPPSGEDLIVGTSNTVVSPSGYLGVIGVGNDGSARSTLVVGDSNSVSPGLSPGTGFSIVAGTNNVLTGGKNRNLVSGYSNTVDSHNSFVAGANNTMDGFTVGAGAHSSAIIGSGNQIASSHGWAMGYYNEITGDYGMALGNSNKISNSYAYALGAGLSVNQSNAVALGRWNAPMVAGDVLAVGTGSSAAPATALRVTSDGGVILGRAQGDISMGEYGN